jgi:hypothetical protein
MEPEGSLPHSQEPITCPYPETDRSGKTQFKLYTVEPLITDTAGEFKFCPL